MSLAAVILAGGASSRMGRPKALLPFRGETILDRLIGLYLPFCSPVIVVLGHAPEAIRAGMARGGAVQIVVNPDPGRGQLSSLQCGLAQAPGDVLFTPVDHPAIERTTVELLVYRMMIGTAPLIAPSHAGRHGHPVLARAHVKEALLGLPPEAMAREAIQRYRGEAEYVEVDDPAVCQDIDLPEDYERLVAAEAARG